jgi:hypothetical protein
MGAGSNASPGTGETLGLTCADGRAARSAPAVQAGELETLQGTLADVGIGTLGADRIISVQARLGRSAVGGG